MLAEARRDTHESQFATILRLVFPLALPGIDEGNITEKEMNRRIEGLDRERAKYYNYFSSQKWGAWGNNDLMISTSGKDIKQVSVALAQYLKALLF